MKRLAIAAVMLAVVATPLQALTTRDLLATIAMPLAVAAVADVAGVPEDQLGDLVATLNQANVPPTEFVEVIRYVPVALVTEEPRPVFVDYVRTEVSRGVTGNALIDAIVRQLRTNYDVTPQITVVASRPETEVVTVPRTIIVDREYIPTVVQTRVAEVRTHPHGGPPGQLKKLLGLKTGAEVVHGSAGQTVVERRVIETHPVTVVERHEKHEHEGHAKHEEKEKHGHGHHGMPPGQAKRIELVPQPMISAVPAQPPVMSGKHGHEGGMPPGQMKKIEKMEGGKGHGKKD